MKFLYATQFLLLSLLAVSAMDARKKEKRENLCYPERTDKVMIFPHPTVTDYAMKENAFLYDLDAVTVCFIASNWFHAEPKDNQCPFSYAVPGSDNELTLCTSPTLRVLIHGKRRDAGFVGLSSLARLSHKGGQFHHICFTWSNRNGDYQFYKDGVLVTSGTDFQKGTVIHHGGTVVVGQDQDTVRGDFDADQAFVGALFGVNVWGVVLSQSDIEAQYRNCHVTQGSVTWWSQLYAKENLHGRVIVT